MRTMITNKYKSGRIEPELYATLTKLVPNTVKTILYKKESNEN